MHIRDAVFVVTDTETTGTSPARDRLTEIGAVKVHRGKIVDRFSQLINPGRAVPRYITELTGISTAMLFNQPSAAEVLPRFLEFLGDDVLVAHNLSFDQQFLNAELERLGAAPLKNRTLCTLRLARRLLPGLKSKSLPVLADFFKVQVKNRHRAEGDAEVAAEVLQQFLSRLAFEYGIETLEQVLSFQHRRYSEPKREPKHLQRLRASVLSQLPATPGVYFMRDRQDQIIYIGKAKNLQARVRSYFNAIEAHPPRTHKLVESVRNITWTETGSELAALLLESKLIKQHQPRFNRALRRYRNRPFIRLDTGEPFPRISWASYLMNDGAEYFGPLGGRRQAELVVEFINRFFHLRECDEATFRRGHRCLYAESGRCNAPCEDEAAASAYVQEVQRVRDFLTGRDSAVLDLLAAEMKAAAAQLDFEQAALYRDWLRRLERMLARQQSVAKPILEHNAVLLNPGMEKNAVQLFVVRFGRHIDTVTLGMPAGLEEIEALRERLSLHFDPAQAQPDRYFKEEIDEVRVLAHWMYVYRDSARQVHWHPDRGIDALVEEIKAQIALLLYEDPESVEEI